jgi:GNAT superfamily N-acetyltransferase
MALTIDQVETPEQLAAVRELLGEYLAWTSTIEVDAMDAPTFHGIEAEVATLPGVFGPPSGRLLIAMDGLTPIGCVAFKRVDDTTCELKRFYVRSAFRGQRVGRRLVERLLDQARSQGYRTMILDSHVSMTAAHRIYREFGFETTTAPEDFPDRLKPVVVFMRAELTGRGG